MNTTFLTQLKTQLPEPTWPWVIAALRQDELVWETLIENDSRLPVPEGAGQHPENWNPAWVAFSSLEQPAPTPNATLSLGLRQRAFQTYETVTQRRQAINIEEKPIVRAALLALALRERLRLTGKWDNLVQELSHAPASIWRTPLACLYGLIDKPLELLHALLIPGASPDIQNLAVHAMLSNPLSSEAQSSQLQILMENLPLSEKQNIIKHLTSIRPGLAAELARATDFPSSSNSDDSPLTGLIDDYQRAEISIIAGNRAIAISTIHAAQANARLVQASLAAKNAQVSDTPIPFWKVACEYAPEQPIYRSRLAMAYLDSDQPAEARAILDPSLDTGHPVILFATARLAYLAGDIDKARQLASQTLSNIETHFDPLSLQFDLYPSLPVQLGKFFLTLDLPSAAIRAIRIALRERSDDPERLILMGQAQSSAAQPLHAAEAYQWAVLLAPHRIDFHRPLAACLEAAGEWAMALDERKLIASALSSQPEDQYALADCALHNQNPTYAIDICNGILHHDPTDGMAHAILGEALADQGDLVSAQDEFTLASEMAPNLPRPWLALSNAYNLNSQPQKALETLRVAVQAIPGSAEVHLALGEQYITENSTTQALAEFQRANEIDSLNIPIALRYGQTLYKLGHLPQAHQIMKRAYQQDPANAQVAHTYARILLGQDDAQTALPPLEIVIASNPVDPAPFVDYARAMLLTHGDATKATQALRHALGLSPGHFEAQALLGESLAAEQDNTASLQAFQTALDNPQASDGETRSRLCYGLGNVALRLGKTEIAITALLEAVQLDPQNYRPHCLLVDAYQSARLIPDACQAAREALRLAGDDLPVMIWYGKKTLELAEQIKTTGTSAGQVNPRPEELRSHALQTIARAGEIASDQVDMLLQIADIQSNAGDTASALSNLHKVPEAKTTTTLQLERAAQTLMSLNDAHGAVLCYQNALDPKLASSVNEDLRISLLTQLSNAHRRSDNPQAALDTIEKALSLSPDDPALCFEKANLLIELDQSIPALSFLKDKLEQSPAPGLHLITAYILQTQGKLLEALEHAYAGAQEQDGKNGSEKGQLYSALLAVELERALLNPGKVHQILETQSTLMNKQNYPIDPMYHIYWAETLLEEGKDTEAAYFLGKAVPDSGNRSPRALALQARITARRGNYQAAIDIYQAALQLLGEIDPGNNEISIVPDANPMPSVSLHPNLLSLQSTHYPLIEAALELQLYGIALRLAQKVVQFALAEPLAHLNMARVLVQRAEFQNMCSDADIVRIAPGPIALSEGTRHTYNQSIQDALSICEGISQRSDLPAVPNSLSHWQIRGNAVFSPSQQTAQALKTWAEQNSSSEDIAASYAALRRSGDQTQKLEVTNEQNSAIILTQMALCIAETHPQAAIRALQMAILSEPVRNMNLAIRHYLLARIAGGIDPSIASPAIRTAISILIDEPRWFALAARIDLTGGDKNSAVKNLEQAIQLEPRYIEHHLALGNLYLQDAKGGNAADAEQAVKILERATRTAPDHPEAWLALAHAHRQAGNIDQAAAAAQRTAILAPGMVASYLIQSEIALQSGKPLEAQNHAQTAIRLQPESQAAAMLLSRALQALDRPAEALQVIDKAIPATEQTLPLKLERIHLLRKSKGAETALQAANALIEIYPDEPIVLALLAETQADAGQNETAIRTAQKAILLDENLTARQQASLRLLLGQLLRRAGQLDQAVHHLDEVIRMDPEEVEAYLELGRTHQDRRQQAQALLMYNRAASIAPNDPRPYLQAGLALKEGKDYIESESMLRRAADLAPIDPTIRRQLAAVIAINLVHNPRRPKQTEPL